MTNNYSIWPNNFNSIFYAVWVFSKDTDRVSAYFFFVTKRFVLVVA
jgi:hypothetical protein